MSAEGQDPLRLGREVEPVTQAMDLELDPDKDGYAGVAREHFRWTLGEDLLGRFPSSERVFRVVCSRCGSALAAWPSDPAVESVGVMMGTLDDDPGVSPSLHIFVGSKAPGFEMTDDLPQHAERTA